MRIFRIFPWNRIFGNEDTQFFLKNRMQRIFWGSFKPSSHFSLCFLFVSTFFMFSWTSLWSHSHLLCTCIDESQWSRKKTEETEKKKVLNQPFETDPYTENSMRTYVNTPSDRVEKLFRLSFLVLFLSCVRVFLSSRLLVFLSSRLLVFWSSCVQKESLFYDLCFSSFTIFRFLLRKSLWSISWSTWGCSRHKSLRKYELSACVSFLCPGWPGWYAV